MNLGPSIPESEPCGGGGNFIQIIIKGCCAKYRLSIDYQVSIELPYTGKTRENIKIQRPS